MGHRRRRGRDRRCSSALNIVGVQEAAGLNITLAVVDFATQLLLVLLGFALVFSPEILIANVHLGRRADVVRTSRSRSRSAMIAYTGIETVSNLAEEARDPVAQRARARTC